MWTRRPTIIAGRTDPDDWEVLRNGVVVGRVYDARISSGSGRWVWAMQIGQGGMGYVQTFEDALEAVRERAR